MTETQTAVVEKPKRKMRAGGGKAKGNGFESVIAKELTKGLQPLNFIRTPGSGARVGGKNFATIGAMFGEDALKIFVGDVTPVNERVLGLKFRFSLECKFYKDADVWSQLVNGTAKVYGWVNEAKDDATKVDKLPLLIFKYNHHPIYVAVCSDLPADATKDLPQPKLILKREGGEIAIHLFEDLIKIPSFWYTPNPQ